jgi:predicted cobalt transporter CbtA
MSRRRLEALQWYALFGGALAWTAEHVLGYFVSAGTCSAQVAHWGINGRLWLALLVATGLTAVLAAQASAVVVFRQTSGVDHDAPGPEGRLHFFAVAALVGNVLFLVLVALDGLGSIYHLPCVQS